MIMNQSTLPKSCKEQHNPSRKEQLKKILSEEWQNISPPICTTFESFMPRRIESVIKNKGGNLSHERHTDFCSYSGACVSGNLVEC